MKKLYFGILAFTLALTLCACGISRKPVETTPEELSTASSDVTATEKPTETGSNVAETEKPAETGSNVAETEKPTESGSDVRMDLTGPWHLDSEKNDLTAFPDTFPAYMEFGARMEITSNGQISWCIGIEGGTGTYTLDGDNLTAEIMSDVSQQQITVPFRVISDGETVELEMAHNGTTVYWIPGDSEADQ